MKFLPSVLMLLASAAATAQAPGEGPAAREAIRAARGQVEADFAVQEKACYQRFAVNDCLLAARNQRREALAALRREEIVLNDADRQRKATERLQSLQERAAERAQDTGRAAQAAASQEERKVDAVQRQAAQPAAAASAPGAVTPATATGGGASATTQPPAPAPAPARGPRHAPAAASPAPGKPAALPDTSAQVQRNQKRLEEAQARKDRVARKQAERTKPPAAPLPTPP